MKDSHAPSAANVVDDRLRRKVERLERSRLAGWFAGSARRRMLVAVWVVFLIALPALALAGVRLLPAIAGLVAFVMVGVLRHVVRMAADLPDSLLDEREIAVRDRAYLYAYRAVASLAPLALFAVYLSMDIWDYVPTSNHLWAIGWSTLIAAVGAPSAVLAWIEPDRR